MVFSDRREAGRRLAARLAPIAREQPVVVALPRGGVPVVYEVARALGAPLDVLAVRKLGAPGNPELAIGAVAEDGTAVLDPLGASRTGMTQELLNSTVAGEVRELARRVETYRGGRPAVPVAGRVVVVVDDGLATGLTDLAAVRALRARGAAKIILAVPVAPRESVWMLAREADQVVCLTTPERFGSVGRWYEDFSPVSDEEVLSLLGERPRRTAVTEVALRLDGTRLVGDLVVPPDAAALVLFAHGSGSSRRSRRNRKVAERLQSAGMATLLLDLLTEPEAERRDLVFDIPLLASRLEGVTRWARAQPRLAALPIAYFGASTGAAAALRAAGELGDAVRAVVSRGGRPDLAADRLPAVTAPTLLIVGGADASVLDLNRRAAALMRCPHEIAVVPGAGHLFEEPGALEAVAELAAGWLEAYAAAPDAPLAAGSRP